MRRYYIALLALTLDLVLVAFAVMWLVPGHYLHAMPLLALYFCVVTGLQHWLVVRSMEKSPRRFVQVFLALTVATLFLHLAVLALYLVSHAAHARLFSIAFMVGFAAYLIFETAALVLHIRRERRNRQ